MGELKNLGLAVICFIGGDPLMNLSGMEKIIIEAKKRGVERFVLMSKSKINKCKDCGFRFNCDDCRAIEYSATNDVEGQYYCNYLEQQVDC